jgi:Na+/melibiose symporter-like transporter
MFIGVICLFYCISTCYIYFVQILQKRKSKKELDIWFLCKTNLSVMALLFLAFSAAESNKKPAKKQVWKQRSQRKKTHFFACFDNRKRKIKAKIFVITKKIKKLNLLTENLCNFAKKINRQRADFQKNI